MNKLLYGFIIIFLALGSVYAITKFGKPYYNLELDRRAMTVEYAYAGAQYYYDKTGNWISDEAEMNRAIYYHNIGQDKRLDILEQRVLELEERVLELEDCINTCDC